MDDEKMLNLIAKNAQMGVVGIDAVKDYASSDALKQELKDQRVEYNKIYQSAYSMLKEQGCEVEKVNPMARISTEMMSRMKTLGSDADSKIAEMMVQGNAMGVAKVIKNDHDYSGNSAEVQELSKKLLKTQEQNIENIKSFL